MKVIYKKSIIEKMDEAILEVSSRFDGKKEIEKFVLTEKEWGWCVYSKIACCYDTNLVITGGYANVPIQRSYRGIPVEVED